MGRKRKTNTDLPSNVYIKDGAYYHVVANKWTFLSRVIDQSCRKGARCDNIKHCSGGARCIKGMQSLYQELGTANGSRAIPSMTTCINRYIEDILPRKSPRTQQDQTKEIERIRLVFGHMDAAQITPPMIAKYHDLRGKTAPIRANRELALLKDLFKRAVVWGVVIIDPTEKVQKFKETPRDRYVTDTEFGVMYNLASERLQVLMSLAVLTGQRPADLISIEIGQLEDDGIYFRQQKTKRRLLVEYSPNLRATISRAMALRKTVVSPRLFCDDRGHSITWNAVSLEWRKLMTEAIKSGDLTDRYTFYDLRAKARTDGIDKYLLGHKNPDAMARVYDRKPQSVTRIDNAPKRVKASK